MSALINLVAWAADTCVVTVSFQRGPVITYRSQQLRAQANIEFTEDAPRWDSTVFGLRNQGGRHPSGWSGRWPEACYGGSRLRGVASTLSANSPILPAFCAVSCHHGVVTVDEQGVIEALRRAGARFALVHGSRAEGGRARPDSDLDVGAWWADSPPAAWDVVLPPFVDLVVLNDAPLWLAGRIAQYGRMLFDDDPPARVRWQADTRLRYVDEIPYIRERYRRRREQLADDMVNHG